MSEASDDLQLLWKPHQWTASVTPSAPLVLNFGNSQEIKPYISCKHEGKIISHLHKGRHNAI